MKKHHDSNEDVAVTRSEEDGLDEQLNGVKGGAKQGQQDYGPTTPTRSQIDD